jgi:hypothetical protein
MQVTIRRIVWPGAGWIPVYVSHDGGIVYFDGGDVYVLVVLTKGGEGHDDYAEELIAEI